MPRLKTQSEVATMRYLREKTSIPVPDVYYYDANPYNRLGGEYILMSKVNARPTCCDGCKLDNELRDFHQGIGYPPFSSLLLNVQRPNQDPVQECSIYHNTPVRAALLKTRISLFRIIFTSTHYVVYHIISLTNTDCNTPTTQKFPVHASNVHDAVSY